MYDVVIIGAGVAGSLIADQLSKHGFQVVMLEAGPNEQDRAALVDNFFSEQARSFVERPYPIHEQVPQPSLDSNTYYLQQGPEKFLALYNRRVGGTTWNWLGTTPRFVPNDFKTKTLYGYGEDWPIGYDDLLPWYLEAEKELGVSLNFPQSYVDQWFDAKIKGPVFEKQVIEVKSLAQARNPNLCCGSGICIPICPVQAKYDATIHVNKALKQGTTLITQAVVFKLHTDHDGRITKASYYDWDKKVHTITGQYFIVAAHGIESPKLLLQSQNESFPKGLANRSDQVGRNLMDHPIQLSYALAPEKVNAYRGPLQTSGFYAFRDGAFRKKFMPHYSSIRNEGTAWPKGSPDSDVDTALDQGLQGRALKQNLHDTLNRQLAFCGMCEQLPNPENRVTLSSTKFDYYGLSRPKIYYQYSEREQRAFAHMRSLHDFIFQHVGATQIKHYPKIEASCHIIGTLRMGTRSKTSVVDANCQTHEHDNLFIAGSSVFPTSGTANPTLTLSALSLRLAHYLRTKRLEKKTSVAS